VSFLHSGHRDRESGHWLWEEAAVSHILVCQEGSSSKKIFCSPLSFLQALKEKNVVGLLVFNLK